jgi:hypothetical protein
MQQRPWPDALTPGKVAFALQRLDPGVQPVVADGMTYFFPGPDHRFPFATLQTSDSWLAPDLRLPGPGAFRLSFGVSAETFQSLDDSMNGGDDRATDDRLLPHPLHARTHWVCVTNPSARTFLVLRPWLIEAIEKARQLTLGVRRSQRVAAG